MSLLDVTYVSARPSSSNDDDDVSVGLLLQCTAVSEALKIRYRKPRESRATVDNLDSVVDSDTFARPLEDNDAGSDSGDSDFDLKHELDEQEAL